MKVIRKVLLTLDQHHKQTLLFIQNNGPNFLRMKTTKKADFDDIMPSDEDSIYAEQKKLTISGEDPPKRR